VFDGAGTYSSIFNGLFIWSNGCAHFVRAWHARRNGWYLFSIAHTLQLTIVRRNAGYSLLTSYSLVSGSVSLPCRCLKMRSDSDAHRLYTLYVLQKWSAKMSNALSLHSAYLSVCGGGAGIERRCCKPFACVNVFSTPSLGVACLRALLRTLARLF